jgi:hypothetical protein
VSKNFSTLKLSIKKLLLALANWKLSPYQVEELDFLSIKSSSSPKENGLTDEVTSNTSNLKINNTGMH